MEAERALQAELPLDGRTVETQAGTWTIRVRQLSSEGHETIRNADLILIGTPNYGLTLKIPGAVLVADHQPGDIEWILGAIADWLRYPDPKGKSSELIFCASHEPR